MAAEVEALTITTEKIDNSSKRETLKITPPKVRISSNLNTRRNTTETKSTSLKVKVYKRSKVSRLRSNKRRARRLSSNKLHRRLRESNSSSL